MKLGINFVYFVSNFILHQIGSFITHIESCQIGLQFGSGAWWEIETSVTCGPKTLVDSHWSGPLGTSGGRRRKSHLRLDKPRDEEDPEAGKQDECAEINSSRQFIVIYFDHFYSFQSSLENNLQQSTNRLANIDFIRDIKQRTQQSRVGELCST